MNPDNIQFSGPDGIPTAYEVKQISRERQRPPELIPTKQKLIIAAVLASCSAVATLVLTAAPEQREFYQNWSIEIASGAAACLAVATFLKGLRNPDLSDSKIRLKRLVLMIATLSSFAAESIWNFYVYGLAVDIPFPSAADIMYLAVYPSLIVYLYGVTKNKDYADKEGDSSKFIGTAVIITIVAFVLNLFLLQIFESSIGFSELTQNELVTLVLGLTYPILDAIIIVPAVIIFHMSLRKHSGATTVGGIMLACAMLSMAIGDIGFGYNAVGQIDELTTQGTWDILFCSMYILLCGYLLLGETGILSSRMTILQMSPKGQH